MMTTDSSFDTGDICSAITPFLFIPGIFWYEVEVTVRDRNKGWKVNALFPLEVIVTLIALGCRYACLLYTSDAAAE